MGVLGSHARGELREVSDIDYYVVFDDRALASAGSPVDAGRMSAMIDALTRHVREVHAATELAARFSVFWTTLESLERATYSVGRWGPYDRAAMRDHGRYLAGKAIPMGVPPPVDRMTLILDSALFLVDVLRVKLESAGLFWRSSQADAEWLSQLDPVVLTKAVLMPIRMLYLLVPHSEQRPIASTEVAVQACSTVYGAQPWWPLVEAAARWRAAPWLDSATFDSAARLMCAHFVHLYSFCLSAYEAELAQRGCGELAARLREWAGELRKVRMPSYPHPDDQASCEFRRS